MHSITLIPNVIESSFTKLNSTCFAYKVRFHMSLFTFCLFLMARRMTWRGFDWSMISSTISSVKLLMSKLAKQELLNSAWNITIKERWNFCGKFHNPLQMVQAWVVFCVTNLTSALNCCLNKPISPFFEEAQMVKRAEKYRPSRKWCWNFWNVWSFL